MSVTELKQQRREKERQAEIERLRKEKEEEMAAEKRREEIEKAGIDWGMGESIWREELRNGARIPMDCWRIFKYFYFQLTQSLNDQKGLKLILYAWLIAILFNL